ncbi:hypothetical protein [Microbacterium sp. TWP3-1-2b2]|uniref:hypothetical protein n=1 Tax=Microbacterium sp. TWP3-1-2b2 TaxID=2804651 RepID=UPI003CE7FDC0
MSGPAWRNTNRSTHRAVRDLAVAYLDREGIPAITKRMPKGLSDSLDDDAIAPDLALDGVDLDVSSRLSPFRLSESLESVQRTAQIRGVPAYGFIQWRGDHEIRNSYVVLDLASFARLVRGDHIISN